MTAEDTIPYSQPDGCVRIPKAPSPEQQLRDAIQLARDTKKLNAGNDSIHDPLVEDHEPDVFELMQGNEP